MSNDNKAMKEQTAAKEPGHGSKWHFRRQLKAEGGDVRVEIPQTTSLYTQLLNTSGLRALVLGCLRPGAGRHVGVTSVFPSSPGPFSSPFRSFGHQRFPKPTPPDLRLVVQNATNSCRFCGCVGPTGTRLPLWVCSRWHSGPRCLGKGNGHFWAGSGEEEPFALPREIGGIRLN